MTRSWATDMRGKKRRIWMPLLAACLLLSGCAALLERSYSVVDPYSDRYWDSSAEDTLRAESHQDLVTSILMLIEQRAEEGVIRCYGEANAYGEAASARDEVRRETVLGAYLLREIRFTYESGTSYSTVTFRMTYREGAEDVDSIMTLSDTQSLVDLLRLAVREEHEKLTAWFTYDTPRQDVEAAVESLWQELCRAAWEEEAAAASSQDGGSAGEETGEEAGEESGEAEPEAPAEDVPEDGAETPDPAGGEDQPPEEPEITYPPCPWTIRFYPSQETVEIVEIIL